MKFEYSKGEDALYVYFKEVEVSRSEDVDEGVIVDYDARGDAVGIEVLDASSRIDMSDYEGVGWLVHRLLTQDRARERPSSGQTRRSRRLTRGHRANPKRPARKRVMRVHSRRRGRKRVQRETSSRRSEGSRMTVSQP